MLPAIQCFITVLIVAAACGGSTATSTTRPSTTQPATPSATLGSAVVAAAFSTDPGSAPTTPHDTTPPVDEPLATAEREPLIRATFAALTVGDAEKLIMLVDAKGSFARATDCEKGAQTFGDIDAIETLIRRAARNSKGLAIEILAIPREGTRKRLPRGSRVGGCTTKQVLVSESLSVKVRVRRAGKPAFDTDVAMQLSAVGDRWYLGRLPAKIAEDRAWMAKLTAFADTTCACTDKPCANRAYAAMMQWERERAMRDEDGAADDELGAALALFKKIDDCVAKHTPARP